MTLAFGLVYVAVPVPMQLKASHIYVLHVNLRYVKDKVCLLHPLEIQGSLTSLRMEPGPLELQKYILGNVLFVKIIYNILRENFCSNWEKLPVLPLGIGQNVSPKNAPSRPLKY